MGKVNKRILPCVFLADVLCALRKNETFGIMEACFKCAHRRRFEFEMDAEDEAVMAEIERIRRYGYPRRLR